ncbi:restriction endonuclease subunit S [Neptunomonas japonica]|uniref:Type I restriction enzyme, S subunit n=1 Tax=Neptunomonas japonica JAMM 1380 TaxID=1441457 RepID=A0A7R6PHU1_9GAMM|nr:restriction endonuclease subunit S [Neptunomonas japonica]BBB29888.1 type I restriction enzyme, S subunit [Neptunomonas japonica JAMM 1380]
MSKYQAYSEYKDSGEEWLGMVPKNWDVIQIKHLSTVRRGASPRPIDDTKYFDDSGEYAWTRIADVTASDVYLTKAPQRLSALGSSLSVKLEPGSLFLSIAGSVGKPCITRIKACIHDGFVYFPELKIPSKFLFYVFAGEQAYKGLGKFGTQLNLNTDTVGGIKIGCTENRQLQQIVNFLDHETAKIDTLIEKQQQLIKLLKEKRQAVISHAVTKGLNPDAPIKDSGVEWLGEVPEHWVVAQLKFNTLEMQTGPFGSQLHAEDYVVDGIPLINPAHMIDGKIIPDQRVTVDNETHERLKRHKLSQGEIIFARRGELGRCAIVTKNEEDWLCGTGSLKAKLNARLIPKYSYLLITSDGVISELSLESKGSTMDNLNTETLGRVRLPVPPVTEQNAILKYVATVSGKYKSLISNAEAAIGLMKERRTALISAAVTGKIDVRGFQIESSNTSMEATA